MAAVALFLVGGPYRIAETCPSSDQRWTSECFLIRGLWPLGSLQGSHKWQPNEAERGTFIGDHRTLKWTRGLHYTVQ